MMATTGMIEIDVVAKIARLEEGINAANRQLNTFSNRAKRHMDLVERSAKAVVAAFISIGSVRAFARVVTDTAALGAEIDKLSRRIGVSTEFISRMKYGAETTGATFEDLASAFESLEKATAKGDDGLKKTVSAFNALGINVEQFSKLNAEQRFITVAEAIKRSGASAEATNASFILLGGAASKLDGLMREGAAGIAEISSAADSAGVTVDSKLATRLKEIDDVVGRLNQQWSSLKLTMTDSIGLPVITWINDMVDAWRRLGDLGLGDVGEVFTSTTEDLAKRYRESFKGGAKPISSFLFSDIGPGSAGSFDAQKNLQSAAQRDALTYYEEFMKAREAASETVKRLGKADRGKMSSESGLEFFGPDISEVDRLNAIYDAQERERVEINKRALNDINRAESEHQERLRELWMQSAEERRRSILSSTSSTLGSLAQLADGSNRKAFKMSQRLARAQAIVDAVAAGTAAAKSAASLGPAAAFAAYTSVFVGLIARIKAINSTSYDSGGGGGGGGGGGNAGGGGSVGGSSTAPTTPSISNSNQTSQSATTLQVIVQGSVYANNLGEIIVEQIKDLTDRDVVLIQGNTAQARVFRTT